MKTIRLLLLPVLMTSCATLFAQEGDSLKSDKPQRDAFTGTWLIDNVTGTIKLRKTLEFDIQHRFGPMNSGNNDLAGLWGPSNIRLGLSYTITNKVVIGMGTTKDYRLQDINLKVGLLRQTRSGRTPLSLVFFGNTAIDARESSFFTKASDRLSYFAQLLITRRFNSNISLQLAPSFSHYNLVDASKPNSLFALSLGGKANISDKTAIIFDYNQPLGVLSDNPGLAIGVEMSTGSHSFQVFIGNYNRILPQANFFLNENKLSEGQILLGFNITRLWNF